MYTVVQGLTGARARCLLRHSGSQLHLACANRFLSTNAMSVVVYRLVDHRSQPPAILPHLWVHAQTSHLCQHGPVDTKPARAWHARPPKARASPKQILSRCSGPSPRPGTWTRGVVNGMHKENLRRWQVRGVESGSQNAMYRSVSVVIALDTLPTLYPPFAIHLLALSTYRISLVARHGIVVH